MEKEKEIKSTNKNKSIFIIILVIVLLLIAGLCFYLANKNKPNKKDENINVESQKYKSKYYINNNSVSDFDLYFLQLENNGKNMIYSPLSIKYALSMLNDGTEGESHDQIAGVIGKYNAQKYINSKNMSFANAFFIKDSYKEQIKEDYITTLKNNYDADIIYDSFKTPTNVNKWVKDKTLNLIDNLVDDISQEDFILINALGIDMEWINKIQPDNINYRVEYNHEDYSDFIPALPHAGYAKLKFDNSDKDYSALDFAAVANKYDIINIIGEDKIRKIVKTELEKWIKEQKEQNVEISEYYTNVDQYLDEYMKGIKTNYKKISSSTDFYFGDYKDTKVFAKDLKTYNNKTLQYIGIMPKNIALNEYIRTINAKEINNIITNLKPIDLNSFEEGYITQIDGLVPLFNFDYRLSLVDDLKKLGITNIFTEEKANLTKLTTNPEATINKAEHKSNIDFSNEGIKAAAAAFLGGSGGGDPEFDYKFKVPIKTIDLQFNKPFLFLIRDKDTNEIWFTGTVYTPSEYTKYCPGNCTK